MKNSEIVNIAVEHIHPHPENPRKNLGELSELAESLKKNGVMQNLTVIPMEGQPGEYIAIIGHRRHAAAQLAELTELPCKIVEEMSHKEQVSTMLEENMQRNDLTIWEQAQGFQLMLDLGETEDSIAEKTGFSKATIKRRLNIAKLNQKELIKKEKDPSFQLNLTDLYELEKVEDIKVRNKILKEATDSRNLVSRARTAVKDAERKKKEKEIISMLQEKGVKKAPDKAENELWSDKWEKVKTLYLEDNVPKRISLKKKKDDVLYYVVYYRYIYVIKEKPKTKKELTPWEIKQKEIIKNKKKVNAVLKEMNTRRKEFIQDILDGKIGSDKKEPELIEEICRYLVLDGCSFILSLNEVKKFFVDEVWRLSDEEDHELRKKIEALNTTQQMLIALHMSMQSNGDIMDYQGYFIPKIGLSLKKGYNILKHYGWFYKDDEEKVINGKSELYEKGEK